MLYIIRIGLGIPKIAQEVKVCVTPGDSGNADAILASVAIQAVGGDITIRSERDS